MYRCNLVRASCWNENAIVLGKIIPELEPKAKGKGNLIALDENGLLFIVPPSPKTDFAWSDQCFIEHTSLKHFLENPVLA